MNNDFVNILTYSSGTEAFEVAQILEQNDIKFQLSTEKIGIGAGLPSALSHDNVYLYVRKAELDKVKSVLKLKDKKEGEYSGALNDFTKEELMDVVYNSAEWNTSIVEEANLLLKDQGIKLDKDHVSSYREKIKTKQKRAARKMLYFGYGSALLGGLFGILVGFGYVFMKEKDDEGKYKHIYEPDTRKAGLLMMGIGIFEFILYAIYRLTLY